MEKELIFDLENAEENLDMVTMFDDCENGFLAKKNFFLTWLLS